MFEIAEHRRRLANLQRRIRATELDTFLVCTDTNIRYLTGVDFDSEERNVIMVVPRHGDITLLVPRMEFERLNQGIATDKVIHYWDMDARPGRGWLDQLGELLGSSKHIGLEPFVESNILSELADYQWSVHPLMEDLRVIKSPCEIALTKRIAGYWTKAMNNMLGNISVGKPIRELMCIGEKVIKEIFAYEDGADHFNTKALMFYSGSPESSNPHYFSMREDDVIPNGPTVINSMGSVNWYTAENERTVLVGDYSAEQAELFDLATHAQQLALDLIRPGMPCAEVDCQVQEFFFRAGVAEHIRHRIGHGFGMLGHERPYTSEGSTEIFQPNMIISVEPGLYVPGIGGFRQCDTVLITDTGIENLTLGTPKVRKELTF